MTTIKIVFRGDIRRVTVTDFASLLASVGTSYKIEDFVIKYLDDDGDRVSIATSEEFDAAVKATEGKKVLKLLIVVPKTLQERKEAAEASNSADNKEGDDEDSHPRVSLPSCPSPRDPFDHGVACQGCGVRIIGTLYQCTVCRNVSVCATCEERNVHDSAHTLLKFRVPASASKCHRQRGEWQKKKWGCCLWKKARRFAVPIVFVAVLRHLPFMLCLLALWAGFQYMRKRRAFLKQCSECTHKENCRVGQKANKLSKSNGCGLIPKILFVVACLLVRALPIWLLVIFTPLVMCACRKLRRLKKEVCLNKFRGNVGSMCGQYKDILQMSWPQLMQRVHQNQAPRGAMPQSVMGCAALAASESLAASIAAVVALSEGVAAELGVTIPVAVPVNATLYAQQTRILKEMGFDDTPVLRQLLAKHSGNVQAVITDVMQLKPKA